MTTDDRDSLARIIFTVTEYASWQSWELTSDGWRNLCRAKADEAMAGGWQKVGWDERVVKRTDIHDAMIGITCNTDSSFDRDILKRLVAALADPAGANGGE